MKETRVFKKDGYEPIAVEYDPEELERFRKKIIDEMSIVDHFETKSPESSYYHPNNSYTKKLKYVQIKGFRESYEPWIDVWSLYCSTYDRIVIPYVAKKIADVQNGKYDAIEEIEDREDFNTGKEYIPIKETIEDYTKLIANYKVYHASFPYSPLCHKEEAMIAEKNIKKYVDILLDDYYIGKFYDAYEKVREMISSRTISDEEAAIIEKVSAKEEAPKLIIKRS